MANKKERGKGGAWSGRTIPPPDPWWRKLWGYPTKLVTLIIAVLGAITTYGAVQPGLVIEPQPNPSDIYKTEIVLHNKGPFDLEDVEVDVHLLWLQLPVYIIQAVDGEEVFIGEKRKVADEITKDNPIQFRLPNIFPEQQIITNSAEHSHVRMDLWKKVGVCLHISFRSFPYFSWRALPFRKITRTYGLMADRKDTITFSDKRSCRYVEHWIKEYPISPTPEHRMRLYARGGRYLK
jgi:hypothetical protein